MIQNLLANWKTTSTGLTMVVGAIVHLIFVVKAGKLDEPSIMTAFGIVCGGFGLIMAGDASQSAPAPTPTPPVANVPKTP